MPSASEKKVATAKNPGQLKRASSAGATSPVRPM
jgi:hypothetical protein